MISQEARIMVPAVVLIAIGVVFGAAGAYVSTAKHRPGIEVGIR